LDKSLRLILHIITGLNNGGAEAVLYRLTTADKENTHQVISLMDIGLYGERLTSAGIPLHTLNMPRGRLTLQGLIKLFRILRAVKPDVVQTWMYHADLVGGLIARMVGIKQVVWGIRHSNLDPELTSRSTRIVAKACAVLSNIVPAAIVSCSEQGAVLHQELGYIPEKFSVIPNGYNLEHFSPNLMGRKQLRQVWGISDEDILLGMVARWHPQKDHANLLTALARVAASGVSFRCVLVGSEMSDNNKVLVRLIDTHGLRDRVVLAGSRDDIPAVMNALDLHVLSSAGGEAFPNVIAEAMACGTPCIVTDVGDAALIVGDTGWVLEPKNPKLLCLAIKQALSELNRFKWDARKERVRTRIVDEFSLDQMVQNYKSIWDALVN